MFKKLNFLQKFWLKQTNKTRYKDYKWELANYTQKEFSKFITGTDRLTSLEKIQEFVSRKGYINFCHSGNAGDIIYALPTLKKVHELTKAPIHLYLRLGKPLILSGYKSHPNGNVKLNETMAGMLIPLIQQQSYIASCSVYQDEEIHVDLDYFHSGNIQLKTGNIARWCSYLVGVSPELWKPWLEVTADPKYANSIIVARSERYRNNGIDYKFLSNYNNVFFLGVDSEYEDMKKYASNLGRIQIENFLEMAQIIRGAKLFIGNQSFPFSLAEGMKVPRILETSFDISNVVPEGENAHDFFFQEHLESLVSTLSK